MNSLMDSTLNLNSNPIKYLELNVGNVTNLPNVADLSCTFKVYETGYKKVAAKTTSLTKGYRDSVPSVFSTRNLILPISENFYLLTVDIWHKHLVKEVIGNCTIRSDILKSLFQKGPKAEIGEWFVLSLERPTPGRVFIEFRYLTEEESVEYENRIKYKRKRKEIKKIFNIDEAFYKAFPCAVEKKGQFSVSAGKIFITKSYILFHSTLGHTQIKIPFSEILRLERKNTSTFLGEALVVRTEKKTYTFQNFLKRDKCFQLLWELLQRNETTICKLSPEDIKYLNDLSAENPRLIDKFTKRFRNFPSRLFGNSEATYSPNINARISSDTSRRIRVSLGLEPSEHIISNDSTKLPEDLMSSEYNVNDILAQTIPKGITPPMNYSDIPNTREPYRFPSISISIFFSCIFPFLGAGLFHVMIAVNGE